MRWVDVCDIHTPSSLHRLVQLLCLVYLVGDSLMNSLGILDSLLCLFHVGSGLIPVHLWVYGVPLGGSRLGASGSSLGASSRCASLGPWGVHDDHLDSWVVWVQSRGTKHRLRVRLYFLMRQRLRSTMTWRAARVLSSSCGSWGRGLTTR